MQPRTVVEVATRVEVETKYRPIVRDSSGAVDGQPEVVVGEIRQVAGEIHSFRYPRLATFGGDGLRRRAAAWFIAPRVFG